MSSDVNERKIGNLVIFFVTNTENCGIMKLCKLLYFSDFLHFRQTGKSITGYMYKAWDMGPVPLAFYNEFKCDNKFLHKYVTWEIDTWEKGTITTFKPVKKLDPRVFSEREMEIMTKIANEFRSHPAQALKDLTHKTLPYHNAYLQGSRAGKSNTIDYLDSIKPDKIVFKGFVLPQSEIMRRMENSRILDKAFAK